MGTRRWIFVHIPKTGGTSIMASLPYHLCALRPGVRHWSARDIRATDRAAWEEALTISVIRNPWDRAVSAWAFQRDSIGAPDFPRWLHGRPMLSQWAMLTAREQVIVDHLIRFEKLREGFDRAVELLGCPPYALEHLNKSSRRGAYREHYTSQEMIDRVARQYPLDVREFGYRF